MIFFFGIEFVIENKVSLSDYQMEEMLHQFVKKDPSLVAYIAVLISRKGSKTPLFMKI